MNISIFDVTGPIMIGPSSSHTAGAAKLARIARLIVGDEFSQVSYENTVKITIKMKDYSENVIVGSSIGGGRILIQEINGFCTEVSFDMPTVVISQRDMRGVISNVTGILARSGLNIASMRVSRTGKGELVCCIVETDSAIPKHIGKELLEVGGVQTVRVINP